MDVLWVAFEEPQRGSAYQPRVQPWEERFPGFGVLKERRISRNNQAARGLCGVPSERTGSFRGIPRVLPWAGMPRPVGAFNTPLLCEATAIFPRGRIIVVEHHLCPNGAKGWGIE